MTEIFDTVDAYLVDNFKIGLQQVLIDASVDKITPELLGVVEIDCLETGGFECSDGGKVYHCEGSMTLAGAAYRYRVWIYQKCRGTRYMTDLMEFTSMEGQAIRGSSLTDPVGRYVPGRFDQLTPARHADN